MIWRKHYDRLDPLLQRAIKQESPHDAGSIAHAQRVV
jgi:hypothetical protein